MTEEEKIIQLYQEMYTAMVNKDRQVLERAHDDSFVLVLEILRPENIRDTLHAYQLAKRCNEKRVMAECVRWGEHGAGAERRHQADRPQLARRLRILI